MAEEELLRPFRANELVDVVWSRVQDVDVRLALCAGQAARGEEEHPLKFDGAGNGVVEGMAHGLSEEDLFG